MRQNEQLENRLCEAVALARARFERAKAVFTDVNNDIPSGLPQPDGLQRIRNAGAEYTAARLALMAALNRLNQLVLYGVVPTDLREEDLAQPETLPILHANEPKYRGK